MPIATRGFAGLALLALIAGCGQDQGGPLAPPPPGPPDPALGCGASTTVALAAGDFRILGPAALADCVRLGAGDGGAEYVAVVYSAAATIADGGVAAPFRWRSRGARPAAAAPTHAAPFAAAPLELDFHAGLRAAERRLARAPRAAAGPPPARIPPPGVGHQRTFGVCADVACSAQVPVAATARFVGRRVAILVEDDLPAGGFEPADFTRLGRMFDDHIYPADTAAFGRESDVDHNGVVYLVITRRINALCFDAGGIVTGYFFGRDLLPELPGSNGAEVFFALAPDPAGESGCRVTRDLVERVLPPTFAHELQHMISYNQHVLTRNGDPEETWLNEGLSHLAEELVGRAAPNELCVAADCFSQFSFNDVSNAYRYLESPESWFLLYPSGSTGRLAERGASFLLTRWLSDHFDGPALTRRLVATGQTGAANLAAATGLPFATILGEWHLANYLDDLPDFEAGSGRLRYRSWNWRVTFPSLRAQYPQLYSRPWPLAPDSTAGSFDYTGSLRGGSGRFARVAIPAGAEPIDFRLTGPDGAALPADLAPHLAVVRIR